MPAVTIYSDSDTFAGAAGTDLTAHTTANGNAWVNMNNQAGRFLLDGGGGVRYELPIVGTSTHTIYFVNITDVNFPVLSNDEYLTLLMSIDAETTSGGARQWETGMLLGIDTSFNAVGVSERSLDFAVSVGKTAALGLLNAGSYSGVATGVHTTLRDQGTQTLIEARIDPYQTRITYSGASFPGGAYRALNFEKALLRNSAELVPGVVMFSSGPFGGTQPRVNSITFAYQRLVPLQLYPRWTEYGKTAVIDTGLLSFTDAFTATGASDEALQNQGGFDIFAPKHHADRLLQPHMLTLDNRQNGGIVDVLIGPFRWRASPGTEMEVPLAPELNIDKISLRGGGTRSRCRIFASEIPKTFRQ